ncbi:hypothetical protein BY458DRAFT_512131 [Sporodiniella umbellata]|nr:hypothetical protein BY458DRAFT_512131 [Sporodiniella umbellata]
MSRSSKDSVFETDFGVKSLDDNMNFNTVSSLTKRTSISTSSVRLKDNTQHFRMIVCGDSGVGKSALVSTLTAQEINPPGCSTEITELYVPFTNICIADTCGYGASVRADIIFSNTKKYLEGQFEQTHGLFHPSCQDDPRLTYILENASSALTHVDACLYLFSGRLKPVDIEYMRSIHELVSIIPVLIQPDLSVRMDQMAEQRLDIVNTLIQNQIRFCTLGFSQDETIKYCKQASPCSVPFVVNWSPTKPVFHGLTYLKQVLFDTHLNYLRKQTTHHFLQWRKQQKPVPTGSFSINNSMSSIPSASSSTQSLSVAEKQKVSEYISNRCRQLEKEMLKQDRELKQAFEKLSQKNRREFLIKQVGLAHIQDNRLYRNRVILATILFFCLCILFVAGYNNNKKQCLPP